MTQRRNLRPPSHQVCFCFEINLISYGLSALTKLESPATDASLAECDTTPTISVCRDLISVALETFKGVSYFCGFFFWPRKSLGFNKIASEVNFNNIFYFSRERGAGKAA